MTSLNLPPGINVWEARRRAAEKEESARQEKENEKRLVELQVEDLLLTQEVIQLSKEAWKLISPATRKKVKQHNIKVTGIRPVHLSYQEKMRRAPAIKANIDLCMELGLRVNLSREERACLDYETRQRVFYYNKSKKQ